MFRYQARMKAAFMAASAALDVPVTVITSGDGDADEDAELA
jgi:adenylate kinase